MATMYHGTASTYLPSILQEGLHPVESERWNAIMPGRFFDWNPSESEKGESKVFLTESRSEGMHYAELRALYLRALAGQNIHVATLVRMTKVSNKPYDAEAEPRLLVIDLPDYWQLEPDYKSGGLYTEKSIPAEYISRVVDIALTRAKKLI